MTTPSPTGDAKETFRPVVKLGGWLLWAVVAYLIVHVARSLTHGGTVTTPLVVLVLGLGYFATLLVHPPGFDAQVKMLIDHVPFLGKKDAAP